MMTECEAILLGKESRGTFSSVLSWKPDYGAAIVTLSHIHNPLSLNVYVIGLDGWTFTVDANGSNSATCENDPAFILAGPVPTDKINAFLEKLDGRLSFVADKRGNERNSRNIDGGFQRTPGFVYSKCNEVLSDEDIVAPRITPQGSGFTDVGMHTGCTPLDTALPLIQAVLKATIRFGMNPELKNAAACSARFMTEFYLSRAKQPLE